MRPRNDVLEDYEIYLQRSDSNDFSNNINIVTFNQRALKPILHRDVHFRSTLFILVLTGKGQIEVNFKKLDIDANDIVLLSFGHFFKLEKLSKDFSCVSLYISKEFVNEMYSTDMLYKRVKYGVKMFRQPVLRLLPNDFLLLKKRIDFLDEIIHLEHHRYVKEMTLNGLRIFFLDLSNLIEQGQAGQREFKKTSMEEMYFQQFLDLLVLHYRTEHLVDFYAAKIHITPHYLTLIVKKLGGQSVSEFIFQLLYSEAKYLLQQPSISVQSISADLNFSDQSSFGKFFKRNSGLSPREFRNSMRSK